MIELSAEQVRAIVELRAATLCQGALDLALLAPPTASLGRAGRWRGFLCAGSWVACARGFSGRRHAAAASASCSGIGHGTVHRCLGTLVVVGLLEQDGETRRYFRLGRLPV